MDFGLDAAGGLQRKIAPFSIIIKKTLRHICWLLQDYIWNTYIKTKKYVTPTDVSPIALYLFS